MPQLQKLLSPKEKSAAFGEVAGWKFACDFIDVREVSVQDLTSGFQHAVEYQCFDAAERMLTAVADTNAPPDGWPPLQSSLEFAIKQGNNIGPGSQPKAKIIEEMKFLIDHGADVNMKNSEGKTPVDMATDKEVKAFLQSRMTPTS